ncbi:MAG: hypothetical protein LBH00_03705 [Planctomycetaceae bacterium]|nr:hypothetical protein [Planctomycetaceae bacterium]
MKSSLLFLLIASFAASGCLVLLPDAAHADEPDLKELVKNHDDQWKKINSVQIFFTKDYTTGVVSKSFPGCYWESEGGKSRAVVISLDSFAEDENGKPIASEMCDDIFCDGKDSYRLTVPRDKYPLKEIQFCDYFNSLKDKGYSAVFVPDGAGSTGADVHLFFPLPRYFYVPAETKGMTLPELVHKYQSEIASSGKNSSGDDVIKMIVAARTGQHEYFADWELCVFINIDKGYSIDSYRYSAAAGKNSSVKIITECAVKQYRNVKGEYWIPGDWETIQHNGDPAFGIRTRFVINDCRINETSESRLHDFRFPVNFPVSELTPVNQPEKIHVWGADNKPACSFDDKMEFWKYYKNECQPQAERPQRNTVLAFRLTMAVLGLMFIAAALYRLYAKKR